MATNLVHLPEVQRLSPLVIRILGGNPGKFTLQGTNTYLIGTGPTRLLLDTGSGSPTYLPLLTSTLHSENATLSSILLTHWHVDHTGGLSSLLTSFPHLSTKIYKSPLSHPSESIPSLPSYLPIADGQVFKIPCGKGTLEAVYTPGHTYDHMCFLLKEEETLFTGDNVLGQGTAVFSNLALYIESLKRMRDVAAGKAFPGHGPVIEGGRERCEEYLRHRKGREDEVLGVLRGKGGEGWTSMEIVKVVYKDVDESLHVPAEWGVKLVLEKLEGEERIVKKGERFVIKERGPAL